MRNALAVLTVTSLAVALAAPARASGVCDPERPATLEEEEVRAAEQDAGTLEPSDLVAADLILPCALVESGVLGPACQDAPLYVVTHAGVVLCQVNLAVVVPQASTPIVSSRPAVPASHASSWSLPAALPSSAPQTPARSVGDAPRAVGPTADLPPDVPPVPPWGPS